MQHGSGEWQKRSRDVGCLLSAMHSSHENTLDLSMADPLEVNNTYIVDRIQIKNATP